MKRQKTGRHAKRSGRIMVSRPVWRGHLRLALVSCPVVLHSVVRSSSGLHFHLVNPHTGHRIRMVAQDAETNEEVSRGDLVKGYEFEKDHYVLLEDEDFDSARIDSSITMTIGKFVDAASIDPIFFDTSYYLVPDGEVGQDVFVVLRDAIRKSHRAALSRVVLARRDRAVAIVASGDGLVCHTLHEQKALWDAGDLFAGLSGIKAEAEMVELASQLIKRQSGTFKPDDTEDRYEARLKEVIDAKLQGEGLTSTDDFEPDRGNVVDLMAALKASLGQQASPGARKKPRKRKRAS